MSRICLNITLFGGKGYQNGDGGDLTTVEGSDWNKGLISQLSLLFNTFKIPIIIFFFFGCIGYLLLCKAFSSYGEWGYSSRCCTGLSLWWLLSQSKGSTAHAQQLRHMGLVAPWRVGSSRTRDRTCGSCIGRWILIHCTTREVPIINILNGIIINSYHFYEH